MAEVLGEFLVADFQDETGRILGEHVEVLGHTLDDSPRKDGRALKPGYPPAAVLAVEILVP